MEVESNDKTVFVIKYFFRMNKVILVAILVALVSAGSSIND